MKLIIQTLILLLYQSVNAQLGTTIPTDRITDWERSGFNRIPAEYSLPIISDACNTIYLSSPNGINDYSEISTALSNATSDPCITQQDDFVIVQLQAGNYRTDRIIDIPSNVLLNGKGVNQTTIIRLSGAGSSTTLRTMGSLSETYVVNNYNSEANYITLSSPNLLVGDFIDIQMKHPNWAESQNSIENNVLGQVVKIISKDVSSYPYKFYLDDDFSYVWDVASANNLQNDIIATKLNVVQHSGVENLTIDNESNDTGYLIHIVGSNNIWINNFNSFNAVSSHINIVKSTQVEVRNSYIHGAKNYGVGGSGYGVSMTTRTTNSLIENNIFQNLRSCVNISRGANRNVFGYNYCRDNTNTVGNTGSDVSIHGNFPYLNLVEGNIISKLHLDDYHGKNGPYNTFFRNFAYFERLKLMSTDQTNFLANEFQVFNIEDLNTEFSEDIFDKYDNLGRKHISWRASYKIDGYLSDKSYYRSSKPSFLNNYNWPPIGPRVSGSLILPNDLPARDLYCSWYPDRCEDRFSDIAVLRSDGDYYPMRINRIVAFKKRTTSWNFDYLHDFNYWIQSSDKNFSWITTGDFSDDDIDDILVIASNDIDANKNRVIGWPADGNGFSKNYDYPQMIDHTFSNHHSYNFKYLATGKFDRDEKLDIAIIYANENSGHPILNNGILVKTANQDGGLFKNTFYNITFGTTNINGITTGDFDSDGLDDFAIIYDNNIRLYKSTGENFVFMHQKSFSNKKFKGLTSGDYNGDGIDDIAVYREGSHTVDNGVYIFTSDGSGLSFMTDFKHELSGIYDIEGIDTGDFNNDGVSDIAFYRRNSTGNTRKNRIVVWTSNKSKFEFFSSFWYGGYDFHGISSGKFGDKNKGKLLYNNFEKTEEKSTLTKYFTIENYPNPFNPSTNIVVSIPQQTELQIVVFNVMGQKIKTLFNGVKAAGNYEFRFDANNLSSGIYLIKAIYNNGVVTRKVLLMK